MLIKVSGSAVQGIDALTITLEIDIQPGSQTGYYIVGLPDNAVKESMDRIISAIRNNGYERPRHKVLVNMAPADLRKAGSAYDLPIALGMLAASGQLDSDRIQDYVIVGELSLDGTVNPVKGALSMAIQAARENFRGIILPLQNVHEAGLVGTTEVIGVPHLRGAVDFLEKGIIPPAAPKVSSAEADRLPPAYDFSEVKGQEHVKRALEIAAAGGHNLILIGPPGAGKTMLARRLPGILPPLDREESLETTKIHSVAGRLHPGQLIISERPFRAPHHTISHTALAGGGSYPQPGEISLAHNGVLFLDELPEFQRTALEVLRQPMEEGRITISRARVSMDFPSAFMLAASMNPCPCGYYTHPEKSCSCDPARIRRYLGRISGPLLDRIDMHVEVTPVGFSELVSGHASESSAEIRERVLRARAVQQHRFHSHPGVRCNARMSGRLLRASCAHDARCTDILAQAMRRLSLSARAYDRILRVARTIADLTGTEQISVAHISEAIRYRSLDRAGWGG